MAVYISLLHIQMDSTYYLRKKYIYLLANVGLNFTRICDILSSLISFSRVFSGKLWTHNIYCPYITFGLTVISVCIMSCTLAASLLCSK